MSTWRLLLGDCRATLRTLPADSVQCVVTSPPYWGLRDYGTASWEGGDPECAHRPTPDWLHRNFHQNSTLSGTGDSATQSAAAVKRWYRNDGSCPECGARRVDLQLGLEPTPALYVEHMVEVFREVRRVLRPDGVLWLNLGDSYAGGGGFSPNAPSNLAGAKQTTQRGSIGGGIKPQGDIKAKDLVGIPWRVAFALQADGWWLRSDIIWHKPNPMPESVTDRPTKAHEYLFLLAKGERYYYDAAAIAEESSTCDPRRPYTSNGAKALDGRPEWHSGERRDGEDFTTRNARSVWTIPTTPYPGAHFATFPPELGERCIKAGSKPGDTVLDPFGGSGTVGMVATGHGRHAILCELNPKYADLIRDRCGPMLEASAA